MSDRLIIVPSRSIVPTGPVIFLAGPIQGAPDWQRVAADLILSADPSVFVATPRSAPPWHGDYDAQVLWEHDFLRAAGEYGVVLFWLAREEVHDCTRAYAQTTRFELGEHMIRAIALGIEVVVGIESGFTNERYLRLTIPRKASSVTVLNTLEETSAVAIDRVRQQSPDPAVRLARRRDRALRFLDDAFGP